MGIKENEHTTKGVGTNLENKCTVIPCERNVADVHSANSLNTVNITQIFGKHKN
jgi:hypothetical protein